METSSVSASLCEPCDDDDQICRAGKRATELGALPFGSSVGMR